MNRLSVSVCSGSQKKTLCRLADPLGNIDTALLACIDELNGLHQSLQSEFEFFASAATPNEYILKSKIRQQNAVNYLLEQIKNIGIQADAMDETETKLMGCLLYYGVDPLEVNQYCQRSVKEIKADAKWVYNNGVPRAVSAFVNYHRAAQKLAEHFEKDLTRAENKTTDPEAAPRVSLVPTVPFETLRGISKNQSGNKAA